MESLYFIRRKSIKEKKREAAISKLNNVVKILYAAGAKKVIIFGSILKPCFFDERSDVDVAVEGIPEEKRLEVEGRLVDIFCDIEFDIVFLEERDSVRSEILERIEKEGVLWKP